MEINCVLTGHGAGGEPGHKGLPKLRLSLLPRCQTPPGRPPTDRHGEDCWDPVPSPSALRLPPVPAPPPVRAESRGGRPSFAIPGAPAERQSGVLLRAGSTALGRERRRRGGGPTAPGARARQAAPRPPHVGGAEAGSAWEGARAGDGEGVAGAGGGRGGGAAARRWRGSGGSALPRSAHLGESCNVRRSSGPAQPPR